VEIISTIVTPELFLISEIFSGIGRGGEYKGRDAKEAPIFPAGLAMLN